MTMKKLNIHEAKTHLSRHLAKLKQGETLVLCKRNEPIAEIRPLEKKDFRKRRIGLAKGQITIPPEFFTPLPEDLVNAFSGQTS